MTASGYKPKFRHTRNSTASACKPSLTSQARASVWVLDRSLSGATDFVRFAMQTGSKANA